VDIGDIKGLAASVSENGLLVSTHGALVEVKPQSATIIPGKLLEGVVRTAGGQMTRTQVLAIATYILLLLMCGALFAVGDKLSLTARDALLPIATESFKVVLGALIGAISAVLGRS
jgi:hypothetical protein